MSTFNTVPKAAATISQPPTAKPLNQMSPRDRAVAKFSNPQGHSQPQPSNTGADTVSLASQIFNQATEAAETPATFTTKDPTNENRQIDTNEGIQSQPATAAESAPATATEVTDAPKTQAAPSEQALSTKYAELARREQVLRRREQAIRQAEQQRRQAAAATQQPQQSTQSVDLSKYISKEDLQRDALGTLAKELGLGYDHLTAQAVNAPSAEQIALQQEFKAVKDELKRIQDAQEAARKDAETQSTEAYNQAKRQMLHDTKLITGNNPNFEMIKNTRSEQDVVNLIEVTFKEGLGKRYPKGTLLTVEEAAQFVEDELTERVVTISRSKKIQQKLQSNQAASTAGKSESPKQTPTATTQQPQLKTLTNSVASTKKLSARDRAILAGQGKL